MAKHEAFLLEVWSFIKSNWGILLSVSTAALYLIGYISARMYYFYWNIPFQEIGNSLAPFEFLLQKPSMLFYTLLVIFIVTVQISYIDWDERRAVKQGWIEKVKENLRTYSLILVPIVLVIYILFFMSAENLRNQIKNREYVPFHVGTVNSQVDYRCVFILGNLSGNLILVKESLQPIILKQQDILFIKPMMQPYPQREIGSGRGSFLNENYDQEKITWDTHWSNTCGNNSEYDFKNFEFNKIAPKG